MKFSKILKSNGDLKTLDLDKIRSIDIEEFNNLMILNSELNEVFENDYPVSVLLKYFHNKSKEVPSIDNLKENLRILSQNPRGIPSKTFQKNSIYYKINFPHLYDFCINNFPRKTLLNSFYDFYYDINTPPRCCYCNAEVSFINFSKGYRKACSIKCLALFNADNEDIKSKRKETNLEKYGVEYVIQSPEVKERIRDKCEEKYGTSWTTTTESILKGKQTKLERYGNENYVNVDKMKETHIKNHGIDSPLKISWIHERGVEASRSEESKLKIRNTTFKNHGVTSILKKKEIRDMGRYVLLKNFNVLYPFKSKKIVKKALETKRIKTLKNFEEFKDELFKEYNIKILTSDENIKFHDDVECECQNGHIFKRLLYLLRRNPYCPFCSKHNQSIAERDIIKFINDTLNIGPYSGFRDYDNEKESKKSYCELDIFIPEKDIAIEYNGIYYHGELNGRDKKFHINKTLLCEKKGIQLIHIFEDEWLFKKEIVKSVLLSKLGSYKTRVYARKCVVKNIDTKEKNLFLESNHLQGKDTSTVKLGLFYNDELVACMTFGKRRITGKTTLELVRFCNKLNTQVIGGASKLFKYFIKNHWNGEEIISYADRRWSNGNMYENLGFEFSHKSSPSYWYINKNKREHRSVFMKHKLERKLDVFNPELTEWENMQINGYDRIWDCGCLVYKYHI